MTSNHNFNFICISILPRIAITIFALCGFLFFAASEAQAATVLSNATISENTVWTKSESPYVLEGGIRITSDAHLTIEPGAVIKFADGSLISSFGLITAEGTEEDPIYFTSLLDDSVGGDTNGDGAATTPSSLDEWSINIISAGDLVFDHVFLTYSSDGLWISGVYGSLRNMHIAEVGRGLGLHNSSLELSDISIHDVTADALNLFGGTVVTANNLHISDIFFGDAIALYEDSQLLFEDSSVYDIGDGSALGLYGSTAVVINSIFSGGLDFGIETYDDSFGGYTSSLTIANSLVENYLEVGLASFSDGNFLIEQSRVWGNASGVVAYRGLVEVRESSIAGNIEYGVKTRSGALVHAENNWWGDVTGPLHLTLNSTGLGDAVTDGVDFEPWLEEDPFEETPAIDPLILQYEPILYLHPDEDYQPMNVEAFIKSSALWDDNGILPDSVIKPQSAHDPVMIDDIAVAGDSVNWYLAFSDGEHAKSFDTAQALSTYNQLVASGEAVPTYYAYKTENSYTDDEGRVREFIVLEYWYFYAFNNWLEHGGLNNHEGDWESVFVFLDKETEEPKYVAYSSHLNDGDPELFNLTQTSSVRRNWDSDEVVKDDGQIVTFVALGSHANYPNNGEDGVHFTPTSLGIKEDDTSGIGEHIDTIGWSTKVSVTDVNPAWMLFEGLWGADNTKIGFAGPQGPSFIDVNFFSNLKRFHEPVKWAGIDKVAEKTVTTPTNILSFPSQLTNMVFSGNLEEGAKVNVDLHDENITFGNNIGALNLLPHFWDIESNLENGTFETEVQFNYDPDEVNALGTDEKHIGIYFYNEEDNFWERVDSITNPLEKTASFVTTHFSRYAIGEVELTLSEEAQLFRDYVENADLQRGIHNHLIAQINIVEKFAEKEKNHEAEIILSNIEKYLNQKKDKGIFLSDFESLSVILQNVKDVL